MDFYFCYHCADWLLFAHEDPQRNTIKFMHITITKTNKRRVL